MCFDKFTQRPVQYFKWSHMFIYFYLENSTVMMCDKYFSKHSDSTWKPSLFHGKLLVKKFTLHVLSLQEDQFLSAQIHPLYSKGLCIYNYHLFPSTQLLTHQNTYLWGFINRLHLKFWSLFEVWLYGKYFWFHHSEKTRLETVQNIYKHSFI